MYNGKEYRILFVLMGYESGSFRAGDEWEYTVRIEVESVSGR